MDTSILIGDNYGVLTSFGRYVSVQSNQDINQKRYTRVDETQFKTEERVAFYYNPNDNTVSLQFIVRKGVHRFLAAQGAQLHLYVCRDETNGNPATRFGFEVEEMRDDGTVRFRLINHYGNHVYAMDPNEGDNQLRTAPKGHNGPELVFTAVPKGAYDKSWYDKAAQWADGKEFRCVLQ